MYYQLSLNVFFPMLCGGSCHCKDFIVTLAFTQCRPIYSCELFTCCLCFSAICLPFVTPPFSLFPYILRMFLTFNTHQPQGLKMKLTIWLNL